MKFLYIILLLLVTALTKRGGRHKVLTGIKRSGKHENLTSQKKHKPLGPAAPPVKHPVFPPLIFDTEENKFL